MTTELSGMTQMTLAHPCELLPVNNTVLPVSFQ